MKRLLIHFAIFASLTLRSYGHDVEKNRENEKTPLKLYYNPLSPPSRAVMIMLQILNLPHELQMINIFAGEHLSDNFLRMNPQHTIPVLTDGLHCVVDSHAINMYLMNQYGTDDNESWYPKEPEARSIVDHRLFFDAASLFPIITYVVREHVFLKRIAGLNREIVLKIEEAYTVVEKFLTNSKFIAGNKLTIADISVMISLSTLEVIWPPKPGSYSALKSYMQMCTEQNPHFATLNSPEIIEKIKEEVKMKLYHHALSPSCRAVVVLLKILDLPYVSEEINLFAGDHLREEYLRMNPQHTIPVLIDDEHVVVDSHAINMYLMNEYGKRVNESWYPTAAKARSLVDHRLHFDTGFLSNFITNIVLDFNFNDKIDGVTREMVRMLEDIYDVVEKFLTVHKFIAGNELTIADISAMTSLSSLEIIWRPDPKRFPLLKSYMGTCMGQIPHFGKVNGPVVIEMWKKITLENFKFQIEDESGSGQRD